MKPEIEAAVVEILNDALKLKDFVKGEIPDVVAQLLMWNTVSYSVIFVLCALVPITFGVIYRKVGKASFLEWYFYPCLFGCCVAAPGFICSGLQLLKITLAPKIWLIEYAAQLTN